MADQPVHGDILITSDGRSHLISVIPHPHRMGFATLASAVQLAAKWAAANQASIWHSSDGQIRRLQVDTKAPMSRPDTPEFADDPER
jgi:hypothetical protein